MHDETQREIAEWFATLSVPVAERLVCERWGITQHEARNRCRALADAGVIRRPVGRRYLWEHAGDGDGVAA